MSYYCDSSPNRCKNEFFKSPPLNPRDVDGNSFDSFAGKIFTGDIVINRTFGLLPEQNARNTYSLFMKFFVLLRDYKNYCSRVLLDYYKNDPIAHLDDFDGEVSSGKITQDLYRKKLILHKPPKNTEKTPAYYNLHKTAMVMAFKDSFVAVKNLIVRTENLIKITNEIKSPFYERFFSAGTFSYDDVKPFLESADLKKDCFRNNNNFSVEYLSNHLLQIRNLFLTNNDFTYSQLFTLSTPIKSAIANALDSFRPSFDDLNLDINDIFKRYFRLVKRISMGTATKLYSYRKRLLNARKRTKREERLKKRIPRLEMFLSRFLGVQILFKTVNEFKKELDKHLEILKNEVLNFSQSFFLDVFKSAYENEFGFDRQNQIVYVLQRVFRPQISRKIKNASLDSFKLYLSVNIRYALLKLFRDRLIKSHSFVDLISNALSVTKSFLRDGLSSPHHKTFSIRLDEVRDLFRSDLFPLESYTTAGGYTKLGNVPFDDQYKNQLLQNLKTNREEAFRIQCNFLDNKKGRPSKDSPKPSVILQDRHCNSSIYPYGRLYSLIENGFQPLAPTITFRNRKLKIHLPLIKKKEAIEKNIDNIENIKKIMSVDLGLLRFGTLSCWNIDWNDEKLDKEFASYFIKPRMLFDQKIVKLANGNLKFEYLEIKNPSEAVVSRRDHPSNIWLRIINIRAEIRYLQRKKNLYEQRLLQKGFKNSRKAFRKKKKWNELSRQISILWDRISNINEQIVHNLASLIVKIAKYHEIDLILVEDLKFSHHSKKSKKGRFLSFWQTHWFYSQIQTALDDLCLRNGLPKTEKIYASYSSQECSKCGAKNEKGKSKIIFRNPKTSLTIKDKSGNKKRVQARTRLSHCTKCDFKLDADLSACRVLKNRWRKNRSQSVAVSTVEHQNRCFDKLKMDCRSKLFSKDSSNSKCIGCDSRRYI